MKAARATLSLIAVALAVASCAPPAERPATTPPPAAPVAPPTAPPMAATPALPPPVAEPSVAAPSAVEAAEDALAARMIARLNLYRARHKLMPLRWNAALARAAEAHARDMAEHGKFSHVGSDSSRLGARASRAGYRWQRIAENIAGGQREPETVVDDWMQSPGHRANILEPDYRDAGVGHVLRDPDPGPLRYRHYWVLMLGEQAEE